MYMQNVKECFSASGDKDEVFKRRYVFFAFANSVSINISPCQVPDFLLIAQELPPGVGRITAK